MGEVGTEEVRPGPWIYSGKCPGAQRSEERAPPPFPPQTVLGALSPEVPEQSIEERWSQVV